MYTPYHSGTLLHWNRMINIHITWFINQIIQLTLIRKSSEYKCKYIYFRTHFWWTLKALIWYLGHKFDPFLTFWWTNIGSNGLSVKIWKILRNIDHHGLTFSFFPSWRKKQKKLNCLHNRPNRPNCGSLWSLGPLKVWKFDLLARKANIYF